MLNITASTIGKLYTQVCIALNEAPSVTVRGLVTKELIGVCLELTNPRARIVPQIGRAMSLHYWVGELCYFLDSRTDLASIYYYSTFWAKLSDDNKTVNSAYGHRLFMLKNTHGIKQLDYVVDTLTADPSSRKAVMPIYNLHDAHDSKDNPCTMFLQFFVRDNKLQCHTFMRSNDAWLGLPYDIAFFTLVQEIVYIRLLRSMPLLELDAYFHHITSLHAYMRNFEGIKACAIESGPPTLISPALNFSDIDTWFNDLLTFEKVCRGGVLYKQCGPTTMFQTWCKAQLASNKA